MKKTISFFFAFAFIFMLSASAITVFAGDASGIFLHDDACVFFGEVVSYDQTAKTLTVIPTQKIKGDVTIGLTQTLPYDYPYIDFEFVGGANPVPNRFHEYILDENAIFVMGYGGYGSGANTTFASEPPFDPQLYVFKSTSTDTQTLELETSPYFLGCDHGLVGQWMQTYLNDGVYEHEETERLARLAQLEQLEQTSALPIEQDNSASYVYAAIVAVAVAGCVLFLVPAIKKRSA